MPIESEKAEFLDAVRASIGDATFIKLTLGKYRGDGEERHCVASLVVLKDGPHVRFQTRRGKQDFTENAVLDAAIERLSETIGSDYLSSVLFTSGGDVSLVYSRKRVPRLTRGKATSTDAPSTEHNRQKAYLVDSKAAYLAHLGVTTPEGQVKPSMYAKFRQICRYVEIVDQLLAASELADVAAPEVVNVGAGLVPQQDSSGPRLGPDGRTEVGINEY